MNCYGVNVMALQVNVAAAYGLLDWGGDNWPQPHPLLGIPAWDWEDPEAAMEFDEVQPWAWYVQRMMKVD